MPKISIIMPSLNVRKYIRPCLESVLNQSQEDIEVLAIDAGSTDGTLEILQKYAADDDRLQIICSEQKSYGYQVNLGIEAAKGEYIGIVETDDVVADDMYEILYRVALADDLEYVKCGFSSFVEISNGLQWYQKGGKCVADGDLIGKIISPRNMPELAIQDYYLWAGLYQKNLLKDIRLSETPGAAYQDIGFIYQVLSTADRAVYLDDDLYFYRQTRENSSFNMLGFQYLLREYTNLEKILPSKSDEWVHAYYARMFRQTIGRFQKMAIGGEYWAEAEEDINMLLQRMRRAENEKIFRIEWLSEDDRNIYHKLQENAYNIFLDECGKVIPEQEKLGELLNRVGNRKIIIFGCGKYGKYIHMLLECHRPGQVYAFCDNNQSLWHADVQGIKVIAPKEAVRTYSDAEYVIANLRGRTEIHKQLLELGIDEEQIYQYQSDVDIRLFLI